MLHAHARQLFPTPQYLLVSSVGLDISNQSIRFVELIRGKDGLILGAYGEERLPEGVVDRGRVLDAEKLAASLRSVQMKTKTPYFHGSVLEEQAYLFKLSLPKLAPKELRSAIELSLEDHIPVDPAESVFDYELIDETDQGYEVQVSVLPQDVVSSYLDVFAKASLSPLSLELESQAIARAVVPAGDEGTHMIIDFGEKGTGLSIARNGVALFASTLDFGGRDLTAMVQKELGVTFEEAERLKRAHGLHKEEEQKELFNVLLSQLAILRDEINRHYIYWHTHKDESGKDRPKIDGIILSGGDSNLLGLREYLSSSLKVPVRLGNTWVNVNPLRSYVPEIPFEESLSFATAIGLALKSFLV